MSKKIYRHLMTGVSQSFIVLLVGSTMLTLSMLLQQFNIDQALPSLLFEIAEYIILLVFPIMGFGIAKSMYTNNSGIIALVILLLDYKHPSLIFTILVGLSVPIVIKFFETKLMDKELPIIRTILIPLIYIVVLIIPTLFIKPIIIKVDTVILSLLSNEIISIVVLMLIGVGVAWDLGGPVNKTSSMIANGLFVQGFTQAVVIKMTSGMIAPIGIGLALFILKKKGGKKLIIDGLCFYNETLIPYQSEDRNRVLVSSILGVLITAILIRVFNVDGYAIQGGLLMALTYTPLKSYLISFVIGTLVTMVAYLILGLNKKEIKQENTEEFRLEDYLEEI